MSEPNRCRSSEVLPVPVHLLSLRFCHRARASWSKSAVLETRNVPRQAPGRAAPSSFSSSSSSTSGLRQSPSLPYFSLRARAQNLNPDQ